MGERVSESKRQKAVVPPPSRTPPPPPTPSRDRRSRLPQQPPGASTPRSSGAKLTHPVVRRNGKFETRTTRTILSFHSEGLGQHAGATCRVYSEYGKVSVVVSGSAARWMLLNTQLCTQSSSRTAARHMSVHQLYKKARRPAVQLCSFIFYIFFRSPRGTRNP